MEITSHNKVSRSHLLRMMMLSQRAVDYSIKAYELNSPELCRHVCNSEKEWRSFQRSIGNRSRSSLNAGMRADSEPLCACCGSRINSALAGIYTSATEIARSTMLILEGGLLTESSEIREMGYFVNSLVRLCTVASFKKEVQHACTVLQEGPGRQWFNLALRDPHELRTQWTGPQTGFELTIIKSLGEIANRAYEIAEAITLWLAGEECVGFVDKCAA